MMDAPLPAPPRIASLLPAATEIVAALGLVDRLVARSHECDEPPAVATLPAVTATRIDPGAPSRAIHEQVGQAVAADGLFTLDVDTLAALAPDLILTQAACDVCALPADRVEAVVRKSATAVRVLALSPTRLDDLWRDILAVGAATGTLGRARELVARLRARCHSVASRTATLARGRPEALPRVAMIEWLDPPMAAGNWVPELVRLAGGDDVLGRPGSHSHWITWDDVVRADADVVLLAPCGFTLDRVVAEAAAPAVRPHLKSLRAARAGRLFAVDGHHLLNRPGPRLVESLEVLAELLWPGEFRFAATGRFARPLAIE
jgi:iron complex transport system substrate-binding protein